MSGKKQKKLVNEMEDTKLKIVKTEEAIKKVEADRKSLKSAIVELVQNEGKTKTIINTLHKLDKTNKKVKKNAKDLAKAHKTLSKLNEKITEKELVISEVAPAKKTAVKKVTVPKKV